MGGNGTEYITREGAELMFMQMLDKYERDVIDPRHEESRGWALEIKLLLAQRKGRGEVFKIAAACLGVFWTCVEIWRAFHK